ncbi:MAG: hypothetical protein VKQ33_02340 [Candidatus Sericytochromatia bacterium]|nr:hypothetical protein [Candidatus Sericytochromatia bacterium]
MLQMFNRRTLVLACTTILGSTLLSPIPAEAGMGTGRNPPPPPPPTNISNRVYEGSSDSSLSGVGYPNVTVFHARSSYNGSTSTVTRANGAFSYTLRQGDAVSHRARMFGITSARTNGDIIIATDAVLKFSVASGEADFDQLVSSGLVTKWKMDYAFKRGGSTDESYSADVAYDAGNRAFSQRFVPRNLTATPNGSTVPKVTFELKGLVGTDATGRPLLRWVDTPASGVTQLAPGQNATMKLKKFIAVVEK